MTGLGGLPGLVFCMFLYCAMIGCINPTAAGLAMHNFGRAAGMASALIGNTSIWRRHDCLAGDGAFVTPATPLPLTGLICGFGLAGLFTYLLFRPRAPG